MILAAGAALPLAGCGGTRQDAHEKAATYDMEVLGASFPEKQSIARPATLALRVRNSGSQTVPNVAVTIDSFYYASNYPELASRKRPVWAIERGPGASPKASAPVESQEVSLPGNGQTAYVNTWALGALASGATQTFAWHVVPIKAGSYTVHYRVAAGLAGKAKAQLAGGGPVQGQLTVQIAGAPPAKYVNPSTGRVVAGTGPTTP